MRLILKRRLTAMDDQMLAMYAKGMSTRDIVAMFKELYDADISPTLVSRVTDQVLTQGPAVAEPGARSNLSHRLPRLHRVEDPNFLTIISL